MDFPERRAQRRSRDGRWTLLTLPDGTLVSAQILDVTGEGMRFRTRDRLPVEARVGCAISFVGWSTRIGMRVLWERDAADAHLYGARHVPVVPGTSHLLDNYFHGVMQRLHAESGA